MNPEEFICKTAHIINDEKAMAVVQKICYERTDNIVYGVAKDYKTLYDKVMK